MDRAVHTPAQVCAKGQHESDGRPENESVEARRPGGRYKAGASIFDPDLRCQPWFSKAVLGGASPSRRMGSADGPVDVLPLLDLPPTGRRRGSATAQCSLGQMFAHRPHRLNDLLESWPGS